MTPENDFVSFHQSKRFEKMAFFLLALSMPQTIVELSLGPQD